MYGVLVIPDPHLPLVIRGALCFLALLILGSVWDAVVRVVLPWLARVVRPLVRRWLERETEKYEEVRT